MILDGTTADQWEVVRLKHGKLIMMKIITRRCIKVILSTDIKTVKSKLDLKQNNKTYNYIRLLVNGFVIPLSKLHFISFHYNFNCKLMIVLH